MNMNKILVSIILFFAAVMPSVAQTKDGGISADMLREITKIKLSLMLLRQTILMIWLPIMLQKVLLTIILA